MVHLGVSVVIALISLYVVFMVWHPAPLDKVVGVTAVFLMMLAIDVIVGPLLTFIVAKPNKKSLKFDLGFIIFLQLTAYLYGMYSISNNRPVYIVFDTIRFELVQAGDIPKGSLALATEHYSSLGWGKPKFVAVKPIKSDEERSNRLFVELETGVSPSKQPNLYEPIERQWKQINTEAESLKKLQHYNKIEKIEVAIAEYHDADSWLPLKGFSEDAVVLLNTEDQYIVGIVDLRPW